MYAGEIVSMYELADWERNHRKEVFFHHLFKRMHFVICIYIQNCHLLFLFPIIVHRLSYIVFLLLPHHLQTFHQQVMPVTILLFLSLGARI